MHAPKELYEAFWKYFPRVCADCVVVKDNTVLLTKRSIEPFRGSWCLPGGSVEIGETAEEAVLRELKEETGVTGEITTLVGVYSGAKRDPRGTTVTICYLIKYLRGGRTSAEVSEMKFFSFDEVPKRLAFDHAKMVEDALKVLRSSKR